MRKRGISCLGMEGYDESSGAAETGFGIMAGCGTAVWEKHAKTYECAKTQEYARTYECAKAHKCANEAENGIKQSKHSSDTFGAESEFAKAQQ